MDFYAVKRKYVLTNARICAILYIAKKYKDKEI